MRMLGVGRAMGVAGRDIPGIRDPCPVYIYLVPVIMILLCFLMRLYGIHVAVMEI